MRSAIFYTRPHRALVRFADDWPQARATQMLRDLRNAHDIGRVAMRPAAAWLRGLEA